MLNCLKIMIIQFSRTCFSNFLILAIFLKILTKKCQKNPKNMIFGKKSCFLPFKGALDNILKFSFGLTFIDHVKGAQSDLFNIFLNFWRFWYHMKAHIFLITHVKFHG